MADGLSLRQDLAQASGSQDISKCGLRQQSRGVARVFHIGDGPGCIVDLVVHYSVNCNCHAVFGQNLEKSRGLNIYYNSQK